VNAQVANQNVRIQTRQKNSVEGNPKFRGGKSYDVPQAKMSRPGRYLVRIYDVSGEDLAAKDAGGTSDPFCKFDFDKYKKFNTEVASFLLRAECRKISRVPPVACRSPLTLLPPPHFLFCAHFLFLAR
jgi:hypothetical protein